MTCCVQKIDIMPSGFNHLPPSQSMSAWASSPQSATSRHSQSSYYSSSHYHPLPSTSRPTEIIPRLYISDLSTAEHAPTLSTLGITHILSAMRGFVAIPSMPPTLHPHPHAAPRPITHHHLPLDDLPFAELAAHLPTTTAFIAGALADPSARVLVHCAEGVSRSVSVVAAFLMATYGWNPAEAIRYVKGRRGVADPNTGFVSQLWEYAGVLGQDVQGRPQGGLGGPMGMGYGHGHAR